MNGRDFTPAGLMKRVRLKPLLDRLVGEVAAQSQCVTALRIDPPDLKVDALTAVQIFRAVYTAATREMCSGSVNEISLSVDMKAQGLDVQVTHGIAAGRSRPTDAVGRTHWATLAQFRSRTNIWPHANLSRVGAG